MVRRRKKSRKSRREDSHRKPPRPSTWDCSRGWCRFCGEKIIEDGKQNRRKHWHQECADLWKIMNNPREARIFIFERDKGVCQECGEHSGVASLKHSIVSNFHVDHIKPLFEANGELWFYGPENMKLLCETCHQIKTKTDMIRYRMLLAEDT